MDEISFFTIKPARCTNLKKNYSGMKFYMFRTVPLSETCRVSCQNKNCEISASIWFYYKEICYDAPSNERKKRTRCRLCKVLNY